MKRVYALIFARYPQPGAVKTRMCPPLDEEEAARLHTRCLQAVYRRVLEFPSLMPIVAVTPDERVGEMRSILAGAAARGTLRERSVICWPQGEGDLGRRLRNGSDRAWAEGAAGVILLGADSPTLPPSFLDATLRRLNRYDAIFGPCEDGGYYLLASRRPCEALFDHIDWGGSEVADQTRRRAKEAKLKLHELPYWYDLDRFDDLRLAKRDLLRYEMTKLPEFAALHETIERLLEGSKA